VELTLTISGAPEELQTILEVVANLAPVRVVEPAAQAPEGSSVPEPRVAKGSSDSQLSAFVRLLSDRGIAAVKFLAARGNAPALTAAELANELQLTTGELYGVLGGLGKAWAKVGAGRNPFGSRWSEERKDAVWALDEELSARLVPLL